MDYKEVTLSKEDEAKILTIAHKTIKKVTEDIENDKFNTAVSTMMEAVNSYFKLKEEIGIGKSEAWKFCLESLLQVLAPFAPHIAEELWHQLGNDKTIHIDNWPEWDKKYLIEDSVTVIVQVNGKLRAKLELSPETSEEEAVAAAKTHEKIAPLLSAAELKRAIYVKGKVINLVI